jgi:protein ImuA
MRASVFMAGETYTQLARRIAEIEGRPNASAARNTPFAEGAGALAGAPAHPAPARQLLSPRRGGAVLPLGIAEVDRLLLGGLRRNDLHEIRAAETRDASAASAFATALLVRLASFDDRPVLLVIEEEAAREGGQPYGPGLGQFGLDPARLVVVLTRRAQDTLWVFEEGLRCAGLAAVLCELRGHPKTLDLTASRRLALRARESGVMGLLLRQAAAAEPGAALTRWRVTPRPAATVDDFTEGIGRPAWRLDLEHNRAGPTGSIDLEWDHGALRFAIAADAPALPVAGAALPLDRPHLAGASGTVMAFRRAG